MAKRVSSQTRAATASLSREAALEHFKSGFTTNPEHILPADDFAASSEMPTFAVLPHTNHGHYLNSLIGEIQGALPTKTRYENEDTALKYSSAQNAVDRATRSISQHFEAHRAGDDQLALFHLKNAADGIHDSVLHIKEAETRNRTSQENSVLNSTSISTKNLNRGSKGSELGVFDKLSETLNDYREQAGLPGSTNYTSVGFALPDLPGERVTPSIGRKKAPQKGARSPVRTFQGTPVTWVHDSVDPKEIGPSATKVEPIENEDPSRTKVRQAALDTANKNWTASTPEERDAAFTHFKQTGRIFKEIPQDLFHENEKAVMFAKMDPVERDRHLKGGRAILKSIADYTAQKQSKEAEQAPAILSKEATTRYKLTVPSADKPARNEVFSAATGEGK